MIASWHDAQTKELFYGGTGHRGSQPFRKVARRKLLMLEAAQSLGDLRSPPGNKLEALAGERNGQHSIRVDDQYRVCFVWTSQGYAHEVEIVDYHDE